MANRGYRAEGWYKGSGYNYSAVEEDGMRNMYM
jgi:hypothetical protein